MGELVPASTRVRPSRVRNIDTDRLERRYAWLIENRSRIARSADGRLELRQFARELLTIEHELERRAEEIHSDTTEGG